MPKHWEKSSVPYFAVLSDCSTIQNSALKDARTSYPEVRYVFLDDAEYHQLESHVPEEEEAFIVDLDTNGESVLGYRCLDDDVGVMGVRMKDKDSTKTVEIDVTRSELKGMNTIEVTKDVDELKKIVALFKQRNEQLSKVLGK